MARRRRVPYLACTLGLGDISKGQQEDLHVAVIETRSQVFGRSLRILQRIQEVLSIRFGLYDRSDPAKAHSARRYRLSIPDYHGEITAAVHNVQNQYYVFLYDTVDDDVVISREAAQADTQILVTAAPYVRIPGQ